MIGIKRGTWIAILAPIVCFGLCALSGYLLRITHDDIWFFAFVIAFIIFALTAADAIAVFKEQSEPIVPMPVHVIGAVLFLYGVFAAYLAWSDDDSKWYELVALPFITGGSIYIALLIFVLAGFVMHAKIWLLSWLKGLFFGRDFSVRQAAFVNVNTRYSRFTFDGAKSSTLFWNRVVRITIVSFDEDEGSTIFWWQFEQEGSKQIIVIASDSKGVDELIGCIRELFPDHDSKALNLALNSSESGVWNIWPSEAASKL